MSARHGIVRPAVIFTALLAVAVTRCPLAHAQGTLAARYTISVAGLSTGTAEWNVDIGPDAFTASGNGRASGVLRVLVNGEGSAATSGSVIDGRITPTSFTSETTRENEKAQFRMVLDNGTVKELVAGAPAPGEDRIAVTDEDRRGIVDPISAMLIPVSGDDEMLTAAACQRTLPIFDGECRFDVKLTFQRMDQVQAGKGYRGPALVCSASFVAIAGHRASSSLMKYLTEATGVEIWLVPLAGTRLLAPFRLLSASVVGNLMIDAAVFEIAPRPPIHASMTSEATARP